QRRALTAVLDTLKPDALALPESLLRLIPPRPPGYPRTREDTFAFARLRTLTRSLRPKRSLIMSLTFCSTRNARRD
ncbi:MAG TPA: hypothetical protein VF333_09250, partial [Pyrinomonadaceae bacterium]